MKKKGCIENLRSVFLTKEKISMKISFFLFMACSFVFAWEFTDSRDGQTYRTVKIGNQIWMAENLNYKTEEGSWCYVDREKNCEKYGRLYTWEAAKKACPAGWHLPTEEEFSELYQFVGGTRVAAKKLKSKSGWEYNGNGLDDYGFSVLPAGSRPYFGSFDGEGKVAYFWSASEDYSNYAWYESFGFGYENVFRNSLNKVSWHSVRCLKD